MKFTGNLWKRIKKLRRRTKVIGLIILIVLFILLRGRGKPVQIEYAKAQRQDVTFSISASGVLTGKNSADLHFNSGGLLTYLPFKTGDTIRKGQVIAKLDTVALNASYSQALNNKRNTQANLDAIYDSLKGKETTETFEEKARRTAAEVANDNAYNTLLAAKKALSDASIYAPFSGVIVGQDIIVPGQNIGPTNLIQIVDFSEKQFEISIDQSDIGKIKIGQLTKIMIDAYPGMEFDGQITAIGSQIVKDTTGGVTITVKSTIDDEENIQSIYGLEGQANIIIDTRKDVITIPQEALVDENYVYIKDVNGSPIKREVHLGISGDTDIEVVSGISEGEEIVTNPQVIK